MPVEHTGDRAEISCAPTENESRECIEAEAQLKRALGRLFDKCWRQPAGKLLQDFRKNDRDVIAFNEALRSLRRRTAPFLPVR